MGGNGAQIFSKLFPQLEMMCVRTKNSVENHLEHSELHSKITYLGNNLSDIQTEDVV